ncbi:MAG TPA: hypothetical protein P5229_00460 [Candidatus Gracilibacteria bacterium]|nr:hypothetical protein [Candidatus Gracilibacteria bacterium]
MDTMAASAGGGGGMDDYGRQSLTWNQRDFMKQVKGFPGEIFKYAATKPKDAMKAGLLLVLAPFILLATPVISLIAATTNINVARVLAPATGSK